MGGVNGRCEWELYRRGVNRRCKWRCGWESAWEVVI